MLKFNKNKTEELNNYLYHSCIHDAKFISVKYEHLEKELRLQVVSHISNVGLCFVFRDIEIILSSRGYDFGDSNMIISLTVESDFTVLSNHLKNSSEAMEKCLYMLFQTFSGDELHIVFGEVDIFEKTLDSSGKT